MSFRRQHEHDDNHHKGAYPIRLDGDCDHLSASPAREPVQAPDDNSADEAQAAEEREDRLRELELKERDRERQEQQRRTCLQRQDIPGIPPPPYCDDLPAVTGRTWRGLGDRCASHRKEQLMGFWSQLGKAIKAEWVAVHPRAPERAPSLHHRLPAFTPPQIWAFFRTRNPRNLRPARLVPPGGTGWSLAGARDDEPWSGEDRRAPRGRGCRGALVVVELRQRRPRCFAGASESCLIAARQGRDTGRAMSQENVEMVKAAIDALNRKDLDAALKDAAGPRWCGMFEKFVLETHPGADLGPYARRRTLSPLTGRSTCRCPTASRSNGCGRTSAPTPSSAGTRARTSRRSGERRWRSAEITRTLSRRSRRRFTATRR